jgi:hypothetical protein
MPVSRFPSRYESTCKRCSGRIAVGQMIGWDRTKKGYVYHVDCANPDAKPAETTAEYPTSDTDLLERLEKMQAVLEATTSKMASMGVAIAAPVIDTPVALPAPKPAKLTTKENAQWHELLHVLCSSFSGELIRILLLGPPGTGKSKTSLVLTKTPYRVTMTEGMGVEDLIGMYQLIKGETVWVDGPVVRAMKEGTRILIDEVDHHPTEVGSLLYALLDDSPSIMLPTGEEVTAKAGYGVIATTNSNVTALPEAVLDRFEAILSAIQPHPDALAMFEQASQRDAVANHFRGLDATPWNWSGKPTLRRMRAYARLLPVVGENNAASLAFGTAGRELLSVLTTAARGKL